MKPVWTARYDFVPEHLTYAESSLYETFRQTAYRYRYRTAIDYFGAEIRYDRLLQRVDAAANMLFNMGVKAGDRVGIALPNVPDAATLFFAVNRLGAISVMIHPLSSSDELAFYIRENNMKALFLLDLAYPKHRAMLEKNAVHNIVCLSLWDHAPGVKKSFIRRAALARAKLKKVPAVPGKLNDMLALNDFQNRQLGGFTDVKKDTAAILYSGGSSGMPKGICLSSYNFNALAAQVYSQIENWPETPGMMAILPFFHGFGLGVCLYAALTNGMRCIMVPQFNAAEFAKILRRKKPTIITGVPTLYEALRREKKMKRVDLSFLRGVFCGGDACPPTLKKEFDEFLKTHGAPVQMKEGYGLTETVTACVVTPPKSEKPGAVGVPLPDVYVKICRPKSDEVCPPGEIGEILISSPTVMLGYLDPEDTKEVLYPHADGRLWLRTGDLGYMDEDGFLYFSGRMKRIVKVSGVPVYPNKIEEFIGSLPGVARCCCVAIADDYKMNVIKALIVPDRPPEDPKAFAKRVLEACREHLNTYSRPRVIEIVDHLPLTKVGKVDWREVQCRETERYSQKRH